MTNVMEKQIALPDAFTDPEYLREMRIKLAEPPKNIAKGYGGFEYVPIDEIEASLDNIFGAANWKTDNYQFQHLGTSDKTTGSGNIQIYVAAQITLWVISEAQGTPVWVSRVGCSSDYCSHGVITTFNAKLKAECIKNAAKSLGDVFGRNLNRKFRDETINDIKDESFKDSLFGAKNLSELLKAFNAIPKEWQKDEEIKKVFSEQKEELSVNTQKHGKK